MAGGMKKEARKKMLKKLKGMMRDDMHGDKMEGMKKVTVMSDSKEGLEKGLSKAQKIMKGKMDEYGCGGKEYADGGYEKDPKRHYKGEGEKMDKKMDMSPKAKKFAKIMKRYKK